MEKLLNFFLLLTFSCYFTACSSDPTGKKRPYMSVRLASYIDGLYRMDSRLEEDTLCYYTNYEGERFYADSCINSSGVKVFRNPEDLIIESRKIIEKSCGGIARLVGQENDNEYIGNSPVACSSNKIGNFVNTNCHGGNANYNFVLRSYYRCELDSKRTELNKNELPEKDKKFLDNMLRSGKINKDQYESILNGTLLNQNEEITKSIPQKEEPIDLFLDN